MAAIPRSALPDVGRFSDDPCRSYALPGRYYFDPEIYEREKHTIFNRTWQYVCHVSRLTESGSYAVRDIADQSVVVVRDRDGEIRAFHNVCQHRAHRLLEGAGKIGTAIVCPYHGWAYELGGALRHARHTDEIVDFRKSEVCLSAVKVELLCGFVFVNLDARATPLMDGVKGLDREIREMSPAVEDLKLAYVREIPLAANWKNSVENYSECYHCPNRHPSLAQSSLDMASYQITVHEKYHSHASRGVGESTGYPREMHAGGNEREFGSWLLWPNFCVEVYPGGYLNVFHHLPVAPERTVQLVEWYFPGEEPTPEQRAVIDFVNVVREEDIPLCETVQRGLHSMGYTQGRLVANADRGYFSEHAVHDFQTKVLAALRRWDSPAPPGKPGPAPG